MKRIGTSLDGGEPKSGAGMAAAGAAAAGAAEAAAGSGVPGSGGGAPVDPDSTDGAGGIVLEAGGEDAGAEAWATIIAPGTAARA